MNNFDDIRPYYDEEIPAAMQTMSIQTVTQKTSSR